MELSGQYHIPGALFLVPTEHKAGWATGTILGVLEEKNLITLMGFESWMIQPVAQL
jgi:hypothetical protein